jgi:hypothetical protein
MAEAVEGRTGTPVHRELGPPEDAGAAAPVAGDGAGTAAEREGVR